MIPKGGGGMIRFVQKFDINIHRKCHNIKHSSRLIYLSDKAYPKFRTHKKGFKHFNVTQWQAEKLPCLLIILDGITVRLELYPDTPDNTPFNTVWIDNSITEITSCMAIKKLISVVLSFGGVEGSQCLRQGQRETLSLIRVCHKTLPEPIIPFKTTIIGRWSINCFLRYIYR